MNSTAGSEEIANLSKADAAPPAKGKKTSREEQERWAGRLLSQGVSAADEPAGPSAVSILSTAQGIRISGRHRAIAMRLTEGFDRYRASVDA
jgi:hypothetical protein